MIHEQLISRNVLELADVIRSFHELNTCYQDQFTIYLDSQVWELFDTRVSRTIIRHEFKHFNKFRSDMRKLQRDILNVTVLGQSLGRGYKPKPVDVWSIKSILNLYGINDKYFFHNINLINYIKHGISKKTEVVADCY